MPEGICRLCQMQRALCDSHLIPEAAFRPLINSEERAPVVMDRARGSAVYENRVIKSHLLCRDCENRFNDGGEREVLSKFYRSPEHFPLRANLRSISPSFTVDGQRLHLGSEVPSNIADASRFLHFAIGIFWRGSADRWGGQLPNYYGALGRYQEDCRRYLLGKADAPASMTLDVRVTTDEPVSNQIVFPTVTRIQTGTASCYRHTFAIPGLWFVMLLGRGAGFRGVQVLGIDPA
jgi:hypothetical protein